MLYSAVLLAIIFLLGQVEPLPSPAREEKACDGYGPVTLAAVGDLLIGGNVWRQITEDDYDTKILGHYSALLKESDIVFANFEGIVSSKDAQPRPKGLPEQFSIRSDPKIIYFLKNFGDLVLSFANNHSADFGRDSIRYTMNLLDKAGVKYVGIGANKGEAIPPRIIEKDGIRIAFVAFTDLLPKAYYASEAELGIAELSAKNLKDAVSSARESSDFVVVSLHTSENITTPFSFWPDLHQKYFSRLAVDYGADVVIGQHPHGTQLFEKYKNKLIFYSLGIFLYDPRVSRRYGTIDPLHNGTQFNGGSILTLQLCRDGIRSFGLLPTKIVFDNNRLILTQTSLWKKILVQLNALFVANENT